jgi:uncharacterized protein
MLLNLSTIRSSPERIDREYGASAFGDDRDVFAVASPVTLGVDITKDKDRYHLAGRVTTTLELACSRCLEPLTVPVDATFDLRYERRPETSSAAEREVHDEDFSTAYYDNETLDLGQLMLEQFHLAAPMKPLCREACQGLCPHCGANLNRGACGCVAQWVDPRLEALRSLRAAAEGASPMAPPTGSWPDGEESKH